MRRLPVRSAALAAGLSLLPLAGAGQVAVPEETDGLVRAVVSPDSTPSPESLWAVLPFLFYTPETGVGGGGAAGRYFRAAPGAEVSSLLAALTVTTRKQLSVEAYPDLYLGGGARAAGELRYAHLPDVFYGIGRDAGQGAQEDYASRVASLRALVQGRAGPGVRLGVEGRVRREDVTSTQAGGLLASGAVAGSTGGTTVGLGLVGTWDRRDNWLSPRTGGYLELGWLVHHGQLGSDFDFRRVRVDARRFVPLGRDAVAALQLYGEATSGDPPFSLLPLLGGRERMRGYREGRFRDRVLATAQAEARFAVWGSLGGAVFASAGDVAPRVTALDLSALQLSGGAGLRYRLGREGAVLRADLAAGREGMGLYLTVGQAF